MQVNITNLVDAVQWYQTVRALRWPDGLASFPRKRESRGRAPWGLDARLRGHDILLAQDL